MITKKANVWQRLPEMQSRSNMTRAKMDSGALVMCRAALVLFTTTSPMLEPSVVSLMAQLAIWKGAVDIVDICNHVASNCRN